MSDKKEKGVLDIIKDAISKREDPKNKKTRVGSGGRQRADRIDEIVNGPLKDRQSTDSNQ